VYDQGMHVEGRSHSGCSEAGSELTRKCAFWTNLRRAARPSGKAGST